MDRCEISGSGEPNTLERDRTLSALATYLCAGALTVPTVLLPLAASVWLWGGPTTFAPIVPLEHAALLVVLCLAAIWVHEALHAVGWRLATGLDRKAVHLGWCVGAFAPSASLTRPVPARAYRIGVALPGLLLGIAPVAVGLIWGAAIVLWIGILLSVSALGDLMILMRLCGVPASTTVRDHPTRAGCVVGD